MTTTQFISLSVAFLAPVIYQRGHYFVAPKDFLQTALRDRLGLNLHHAHWGILWILCATISLLFWEKNIFSITLMGFGWGLLIDEICPSLGMPTPGRETELRVYNEALRPTLILVCVVQVILIIAFVATR